MKEQTTKQQCKRLATKLGATWSDGAGESEVEAPDGMVWSCCDVHALIASPWDDEAMHQVWADLHMRMSHGIEPCLTDDCDWCRDQQEAAAA